jgi:hypothetical protein
MKIVEAGQIFNNELYQLPERVIVLIPVPWEKMSEDQVIQLSKILSYVKFSTEGVQILTYAEVAVSELDVFKPSIVLSFGTNLKPPLSPYEMHAAKGVKIIHSTALGSLGDSEKRNLMSALKEAFKL